MSIAEPIRAFRKSLLVVFICAIALSGCQSKQKETIDTWQPNLFSVQDINEIRYASRRDGRGFFLVNGSMSTELGSADGQISFAEIESSLPRISLESPTLTPAASGEGYILRLKWGHTMPTVPTGWDLNLFWEVTNYDDSFNAVPENISRLEGPLIWYEHPGEYVSVAMSRGKRYFFRLGYRSVIQSADRNSSTGGVIAVKRVSVDLRGL